MAEQEAIHGILKVIPAQAVYVPGAGQIDAIGNPVADPFVFIDVAKVDYRIGLCGKTRTDCKEQDKEK